MASKSVKSIKPEVLQDIQERFSAIIESIQFGVEEESIDATLGEDLRDEIVELRDLILENV